MHAAELQSIPPAAITLPELRADSFAFVDKTRCIETLEKTGERFVLFVRPRRFGKSLFASTLEAYYDEFAASSFEKTFRGTYISEHKTPLASQLRVLWLDFSGLCSATDLAAGFVQSLVSQLIPFFDKYPHARQNEVLQASFASPALLMDRFFSLLGQDCHQKLYLLIDECDQFANELFASDSPQAARIASARQLLNDFYSSIQAASQGPVARVFITGVTCLALDSASSGHSFITNVSAAPKFAGLAGFTEAELRSLIPQVLDPANCPLSSNDIVARLKARYEGYRFSPDSDEIVFNPSMCLHYLAFWNDCGAEPLSLTDPRFSQDLSKLEHLFCRGSTAFVRQVTEQALRGEALKLPAGRLEPLHLNARLELDESGLLSALFYFGYLTFSPNDRCSLVVPNRAIGIQFFEYFLKHVIRSNRWHWEPSAFQSAFEALGDGAPEPLFRLITSRFDEAPCLHEGLHLGETSFLSLLHGACLLSGRFTSKTEVEVRGPEKGYIDLLLQPSSPEAAKNAFLVELKYFTKSDASDAAVSKALEEALEQTRRYALGENIRCIPHLKRVAAVFAGTRMKAFKVED